MTSLEHLMQGRRSDRGALVIQFGEMRILYLSLKRMPEDISGNIRAVMLTVAPEDCNPFDSGRLMHAVCEKMDGVTTCRPVFPEPDNRPHLRTGRGKDELKTEFAALTESGGYGRVKVEVI
jgi:hypothetical protein